MGLLNLIFGWNRKIFRLRKKWDRLRERALKKKQPIRDLVLKKLDTINLSLTTLEEQRISLSERSRLVRAVEIDLAEVKGLLETKREVESTG